MVKVLENIGFEEKNGLVFCNSTAEVSPIEVLWLKEADKLGATAVYFRRYFRDKDYKEHFKSEPVVYIFQKDDHFFNSKENIDLHAKIWSAGTSDVYIILGQTRINIINARQPAVRRQATPSDTTKDSDFTLEDEALKLNWANDALQEFQDQRFAAHIFGKGTFWEQEGFSDKLVANKNPHFYLLDYLDTVRLELKEDNHRILTDSLIDRLLVLSILVKFLEEKRGSDGTNTLQKILESCKEETVSGVFRSGKLVKLFEQLSTQFNGKLFELTESEKGKLKGVKLAQIASFLEGDIEIKTGQKFIWRQYDFQYLPPEVISSIYESFIQSDQDRKEKGVVYTPIHLVHLLVDETMPLDKPWLFQNETFKVLDPACGSGVFLVAAYKRMLQWWMINNPEKQLEARTAKRIMQTNVHGVDINPIAVLVSIFSLSIALLEQLNPLEVWQRLKFPNLQDQGNISESNFFNWASSSDNPKDFDLVIGNPPFNHLETNKPQISLPNEIKAAIGFKHSKITGNDLALHFFEGAMALGKKSCLIIKSAPLIYNNANKALKYRQEIFTDFNVLSIWDFTHLRETLFAKEIKGKSGKVKSVKTGRTATCALIAENKPSQKLPVQHIVLQRTALTEKKERFTVDYYDKHFVNWDLTVSANSFFIWKSNLMGGMRLFRIMERFNNTPSIKSLVDKKEGWIQQRGYEGTGQTELQVDYEIRYLSRSKKSRPLGAFEILTDQTISPDKIKDDELYTPPFLAYAQVAGVESPPVYAIVPLGNDGLTYLHYNSLTKTSQELSYKTPFPKFYYSRNLVGISAGLEESGKIMDLAQFISGAGKDTLSPKLFASIKSSNFMVAQETAVRQGNIEALPYPENPEQLALVKTEKMVQDDVLNYYIHLGKSTDEGGGELHRAVTEPQLRKYSEAFCHVINNIYEEHDEDTGECLLKWQAGQVIQTPQLTLFEFTYGKPKAEAKTFVFKEVEDFTKEELRFQNVIYNSEENRGAVFTRVVRLYDYLDGYDRVVFVKPTALRYWLESIGLRDADDTMWDMYEAGF